MSPRGPYYEMESASGWGEGVGGWKEIASSESKAPGPYPGRLCTWDVRRLNGPHSLRCKINGDEISRSEVIVGQLGMVRIQMAMLFLIECITISERNCKRQSNLEWSVIPLSLSTCITNQLHQGLTVEKT